MNTDFSWTTFTFFITAETIGTNTLSNVLFLAFLMTTVNVTLTNRFTDSPDINDLSVLQQRHELLLDDIQHQTISSTSARDDCLKAIISAGFTNCDRVIVDAEQFINDGSSDLTSVRNTWKSEYNTRRKALKENLRSLDTTSLPMSDDAVGFSSISQLHPDSVNYTEIASSRSTIIRQLDIAPNEHS
ncbi:hypothetical protein BGY98DRAFT_1103189 [Russula aff. rugulosa BPL654]|nr:hypothetical protein BGY98DRAFT_1103189 [Russula aff. rugulosa BPL654]